MIIPKGSLSSGTRKLRGKPANPVSPGKYLLNVGGGVHFWRKIRENKTDSVSNLELGLHAAAAVGEWLAELLYVSVEVSRRDLRVA